MSTYDETIISDANIVADKPITQGQGRQFRENLKAVVQGDPTAPTIARKAIQAGGTGFDGAWVDATVVSGLGFFEPLSIARAAAWSLPGVFIARVAGNVQISSTVTLAKISAALRAQLPHLSALLQPSGENGFTSGTNNGGGGGAGVVGSGGNANAVQSSPSAGHGGVAYGIDQLRWPWLRMIPRVGGSGGGNPGGGHFGDGGGCCILLVEGNVDMTGGTIDCSGQAGTEDGANGGGGGGGGGSILIMATGTITAGTYLANGGTTPAPSGGGGRGGGGGGGYVGLIASAFAGIRTKNIAGGVGANNGTDGLAEEIVMTAPQIRGLLFRSY